MHIKPLEPRLPDAFSTNDRESIREASRVLARLQGLGEVTFTVSAADTRASFNLPGAVVQMLTELLVQVAEGRSVSVMSADAPLTTQQAADLLNVSRPYLIRLLEEGKLPFHKTGTHRRVLLADLLDYRRERDAHSNAIMNELAAEAQELGSGY